MKPPTTPPPPHGFLHYAVEIRTFVKSIHMKYTPVVMTLTKIAVRKTVHCYFLNPSVLADR